MDLLSKNDFKCRREIGGKLVSQGYPETLQRPNSTLLCDLESDEFEIPCHRLIIGRLYRPPRTINETVRKLYENSKMLSNILGENILLMGDFNCPKVDQINMKSCTEPGNIFQLYVENSV